jgi:Tol biopolymer transport system component
MHRTGRIVVMACAIGGVALTTPAFGADPSSRPGLTPGEPWIAFQATTGGRYGVHLIRTDGTDQWFAGQSVPTGEQLHPDWSPDGDQLVFDADAFDGTYDLWLMDTSDWTTHTLIDCVAPCLWVQEPAWSPDGGSIAYQRHINDGSGETSQIEILDLATQATQVVYTTDTDRGVFAPRWSPDGGSLVFEQTVSVDGDFAGVSLEVLDLHDLAAGTRTIVPASTYANNSDWSPDSTLISFSAPAEGGEPGGALSDVWVVHPDGTDMRRVTDIAAAGGTAVQPTFTPDGTRLMFTATVVGQGREMMTTIDIDGTDLQPATTNGPTYGWHPRLRPTS